MLKIKTKGWIDNFEGKINGLRISLVEYKFLSFNFYSRCKLRISPGYFIKDSKKISLEKPIYKEIFRPKVSTWYHVFIYYHNDIIIDVVYDSKLDNYENYKRIGSIYYINRKRRIQPFVQFGDWFYIDWSNMRNKELIN